MEKKELIRKIAIKVIAREGYHNAKVQTIADEAGIANGTIYHYFKSKQEILEYIYDVEIEKGLKCLEGLERRECPALEKLESFMKYLCTEWEDDFDILKILIRDNIFPINHGSYIRKMFDKLTNKVAQLIQEGCNLGEFKDVDTSSFAFIILNLIGNSIYKFKFDGNSDNYKMKLTQVIDFVLTGISER